MWSLDDFELGRRLGAGSFGYAQFARERRTGAEVVLKTMGKRRVEKMRAQKHISREVGIQARLRHPHVLRLHAFFWDIRSFGAPKGRGRIPCPTQAWGGPLGRARVLPHRRLASQAARRPCEEQGPRSIFLQGCLLRLRLRLRHSGGPSLAPNKPAARDFVARLLRREPLERLPLADASAHAWLGNMKDAAFFERAVAALGGA